LVAPILGHVGDGNFHALILFKTDEEKIKAKELVHRMVKRAIALDGTCKFFFGVFISDHSGIFLKKIGTGEHGVGIGKREYLVEELGEGTVEFMRMIKRAVDPLGLFNPGKVSKLFSHFSLSNYK
jgi:D-lactate dehydrogenase (cytochrome)